MKDLEQCTALLGEEEFQQAISVPFLPFSLAL